MNYVVAMSMNFSVLLLPRMLDYRKEYTECLGLTLADKKLPNTDKLHDSIRAELIAYHRGISRR